MVSGRHGSVEKALRAHPTRAGLVTGCVLGVVALVADPLIPSIRVHDGPRWVLRAGIAVAVVLVLMVVAGLPQLARRRSTLPLATVAFATAIMAVLSGVVVAVAGAPSGELMTSWLASVIVLTSAATRLRHEETTL